jgi:hypothetical protein
MPWQSMAAAPCSNADPCALSSTLLGAVGCLITVWAEGWVRLDLGQPVAAAHHTSAPGAGSSTDEEAHLLAAIKAAGAPAKVYSEPTCVICYEDFPEGAGAVCSHEHSQDKAAPGSSQAAPAGAEVSQGAGAAGQDGERQGQQPLVLPCGHVFHRACVVSWASTRSHYGGAREPRCPVCREPMTAGAGRSARSMLLF